jgi:hypothetical protein
VPFLFPRLKPKQKKSRAIRYNLFLFCNTNPERAFLGAPTKRKRISTAIAHAKHSLLKTFALYKLKPFLRRNAKRVFAFCSIKKNCILGKMKI